jgi:hypothetical protein
VFDFSTSLEEFQLTFLLVSLYWNSGKVKVARLVPVASTSPKIHVINNTIAAMIISVNCFRRVATNFLI